jgi:hypothetical protein
MVEKGSLRSGPFSFAIAYPRCKDITVNRRDLSLFVKSDKLVRVWELVGVSVNS